MVELILDKTCPSCEELMKIIKDKNISLNGIDVVIYSGPFEVIYNKEILSGKKVPAIIKDREVIAEGIDEVLEFLKK